MNAPSGKQLGLRAAPHLLWFGTLGSAVAWSLHSLVTWALDEYTCRSGHEDINGIPLRAVLLLSTGVFLVTAALSLLVAYRAWQTVRQAADQEPLQQLRDGRTHLMAVVGMTGGVLFVLVIAMGGAGVLLFPVCLPS